MQRATEQELEVLSRFARSAEGRLFVAILQDRLAAVDAKMRRTLGEDVFRMQGRGMELEELIADLTRAERGHNDTGSSVRPLRGNPIRA